MPDSSSAPNLFARRFFFALGFILLSSALASLLFFSPPYAFALPGSPSHPALSSKSPSVVGQWGAPINLGIVAIHSVLLNNGKVLFWDYPNLNGVGGTLAIIYDPTSQTVTSLPSTQNLDFFCAGMTHLTDGRILIDGGLAGPLGKGPYGIAGSVIFDPVTSHWISNPPMHYARYYPTNTQLADGTTLVFSGNNQQGVVTPEVEKYDPSSKSWTVLPASADLPGQWGNYPRMFLLPTGHLFVAGPMQQTWDLDPNTNSWSLVANMNYSYRHGAGAVLLPDLTQVMVFGGQIAVPLSLPTNTVESIDLSQPNPQWLYGTPMNFARHELNVIQLPDSTLLAVGGVSGLGHYANPVKEAELYNPATATWTILASQQGSRGYHSTALLLPDASVISAGSDSGDALQNYAEIYKPPYFFKGPRPTISSSPSSLAYGQSFSIQTPDAARISSAALIRLDVSTHADHFDQRFIPLTFTKGNAILNSTAPANGNLAPPGYYMLFIVNNQGVPSVAPILQLGATSN